MSWTEVVQAKMKVTDEKKLATSKVWQLESAVTSQPPKQQASDHVVKGKYSIQRVLPSANGNKVTSNWRRKLGNQSMQKEANSACGKQFRKSGRHIKKPEKQKQSIRRLSK